MGDGRRLAVGARHRFVLPARRVGHDGRRGLPGHDPSHGCTVDVRRRWLAAEVGWVPGGRLPSSAGFTFASGGGHDPPLLVSAPQGEGQLGTQVSVVLPAYNEADNLAELVPGDHGRAARRGAHLRGRRRRRRQHRRHRRPDAGLAGPDVAPCRCVATRASRRRSTPGSPASQGEYVVLMDADGQDDPTDPAPAGRARRRRRARPRDRPPGRAPRPVRQAHHVAPLQPHHGPGHGRRRAATSTAASRRCAASSPRRSSLYGELHRYIPVLAQWRGFRVAEVDVEHHERRHGESKFGRARFWRGFLDLITVKFLTTYTGRPFHLFGGLGVVMGVVGVGPARVDAGRAAARQPGRHPPGAAGRGAAGGGGGADGAARPARRAQRAPPPRLPRVGGRVDAAAGAER